MEVKKTALEKYAELVAIECTANLFSPNPTVEVCMLKKPIKKVMANHKKYWIKETRKLKQWIKNNL